MDTVKARICVRRDTTDNWNLYPDFVPMLGEIVVYTDHAVVDDTNVPGIKIGDGVTPLADLKFEGSDILKELQDHAGNTVVHITARERAYWNSKSEGSVATVHMNGIDYYSVDGVVDLGTVITSHQDISGKLDTSLKGAANGLAELDSSGRVPSSQLPAYVDDVEEYPDYDEFPEQGEAGKIYVAKNTNVTYRWGGTDYVEIGSSLALGETSSTAYRGDRGKAAYDHAIDPLRATSEQNVGFYKVGSTDEGHISALEPVTKNDITSLGIPGTDTTYESLQPESGGSDVSLVTTGEKYSWDQKYTLPSGGIPASDLAQDVIPDISTKADKTNTVFLTTVSLGRSAGHGTGVKSVAMGNNVGASGYYSSAFGNNTVASGSSSHAEGDNSTASGYASHAEGGTNVASGYMSHAEGYNTSASRNYTHAEGRNTVASMDAAHAEGSNTIAGGSHSHAEGDGSRALESASHAEGAKSMASGFYSHSEGYYTTAAGHSSHVEGAYTIANGESSHVFGVYNVADSLSNWPEWISGQAYSVGDKVKYLVNSTYRGYICKTPNSDASFDQSKWNPQGGKMNYVEIVGGGTDNDNRANIRALDWDGNARLKGDVYVGCNDDSTGGYKLITANDIQEGLKVVRLI